MGVDILVIACTLCGLASASLAIGYTHRFIRLNWIIKSVLQCLLLHHLVAHFLTLICTCILMTKDPKDNYDMTTCNLMGYISIVIWPVHLTCSSQISVIRLYVTKRAERQRIPKPRNIMLAVAFTLGLHYAIKTCLFYMLSTGAKGIISKCTGSPVTSEVNAIGYSMGVNLFILLIGILADAGMYLHLRSKEQSDLEKSEVVPWKSGSHADYTSKIPLNATILSSGLFLVVLGLYIFFLKFSEAQSDSIFGTTLSIIVCFLIQPPLMIYLTVGSSKKVSPYNSDWKSSHHHHQNGLQGLEEDEESTTQDVAESRF